MFLLLLRSSVINFHTLRGQHIYGVAFSERVRKPGELLNCIQILFACSRIKVRKTQKRMRKKNETEATSVRINFHLILIKLRAQCKATFPDPLALARSPRCRSARRPVTPPSARRNLHDREKWQSEKRTNAIRAGMCLYLFAQWLNA